MQSVVQDPTLVVSASHEGFGLFFGGDIKVLVVDSLEAAFDYCISHYVCFKNTYVELDILHAYSLTIDHDIARNFLCCIVYHMLLINRTIHLWPKSHELCNAMSVVFFLEYRTRQLLVEVEERFQWSEFALVHFMVLVLHELSIEVARVIEFREVKWLVHIIHLVNDIGNVSQLYDEWICLIPVIPHYRMCSWAHCSRNRVWCIWTYPEWQIDEKWIVYLAYRYIQLDADEILGIHGSSSNHIIPMLLNDCLAIKLCVSELHFHSFQSSLHEFAIRETYK